MNIIVRILGALALVLVLGGATCQVKEDTDPLVQIDPSLRQRCPELPLVDATTIPMGELYLRYSQLQGQYIECAIRHDCLIEATGDGDKLVCPKLEELKNIKKDVR